MLMSLHKRARTTPAIRQEIAASNDPVSVLAQRYNVTIATIYKWRSRGLVSGPLAHRSHASNDADPRPGDDRRVPAPHIASSLG